jgi:uncharacterized protein (TIRG00374 family)
MLPKQNSRQSVRAAGYSLFWLALALALLWLTLRAVPLDEVWQRLRSLTPGQIALLLAINLLVLSTFSLRWWLLLYAQGYRIPYVSLMGYRLATFAVSYFTPGPHFGGEPLQVYLVTARHKVPASASLAAVVLDKILEMLANFAFLSAAVLVALRQQVWPGLDETQLIGASLLLLAAPLALLAALALGWRPLTGLLRAADGGWHWLNRVLRRPTASVTTTRLYTTLVASETQVTALCRDHPRILILAIGASGLSWVAMIGEFWLMTDVLGLGLTLAQAITAMGGGAGGDPAAAACRIGCAGSEPGAGNAGLHRHAFCQIARLIHIRAAPHRHLVGEDLQRHHRQDRREQLVRARDRQHVVGLACAHHRIVGVGHGQHQPAARLDLLHLADHLVVDAVARGDHHGRHRPVDQRDRAVLHLAGGVALGVDVADLLELERALRAMG